MDKKEGEQTWIIIHWWNFRTKELGFKGTIKDFLTKKDIKVSRISFKDDQKIKGYRFKAPICSSRLTLDVFDNDYVKCAINAIKISLMLPGHKTQIKDIYQETHKLNWR